MSWIRIPSSAYYIILNVVHAGLNIRYLIYYAPGFSKNINSSRWNERAGIYFEYAIMHGTGMTTNDPK